uniref:Uncharacterized protein n=1 Tax=Ananas comosus var. bracteatus TaxID=296719 RepID=A0A6V7NWI5_ANACO|nr:unnamed protein product [Ananas comosus var. bracteatus]
MERPRRFYKGKAIFAIEEIGKAEKKMGSAVGGRGAHVGSQDEKVAGQPRAAGLPSRGMLRCFEAGESSGSSRVFPQAVSASSCSKRGTFGPWTSPQVEWIQHLNLFNFSLGTGGPQVEWTQGLNLSYSALGIGGPSVSSALLSAQLILLTSLGCVRVLLNGAFCFGLQSPYYSPPRPFFTLIRGGQSAISHEAVPQLKFTGLSVSGLALENFVRTESQEGINLDGTAERTARVSDEILTEHGDGTLGYADHFSVPTDGFEAELNQGSAITSVFTCATRKIARLSSRDNIFSLERAISSKALLREGEVANFACPLRKPQKGLTKKVTPAGQGAAKLNKIKTKSTKCGIFLTDEEAGSLLEFQRRRSTNWIFLKKGVRLLVNSLSSDDCSSHNFGMELSRKRFCGNQELDNNG